MKLLAASFVVLALSAVGCAGSSDAAVEYDPGESAEDALTASQLPGVASIQLETTTSMPDAHGQGKPAVQKHTLGSKTKVGKVMRALKTRRPSDPIPLCHPGSPHTTLHFYDAKGTEIATGGYACMLGSVTIAKGGKTIEVLVRVGAIGDVLDMPLVPADVLAGVDEVQIVRRMSNPKTVDAKSDATVAKILGAIDLENIDPNFMGTRCLPSHSISFLRDGKDVGGLSYICSSGSVPAKLTAHFAASDPSDEDKILLSGGVELDPRVVEQVLDGH